MLTPNLKAEFCVKILFSKICIDHQCLTLFLKYALREQKQFYNNALCQNEVKKQCKVLQVMHRFGKLSLMVKKVIICGQEGTEIPIEDSTELIKKSINMYGQVYCLIIYNR